MVILSGWIVLQKRSPVATLAWVLTLAFLPVAGFVVFYFIGPRKVTRSRLKRLRARQALEGPRFKIHETAMREQVSRELARQIAHIGQTANVAPCSVATSCDVLVDGKETFARVTAAIDLAEHHVHVLYYIFEPDQTGTALRDALVRAAKRGCEVRLLVDAVGSSRLSRSFLAPLLEAGGQFAFFNRLSLRRRSRLLNFRNHRKIVVCDGRVGFVGGINVHDEDNDGVRRDAWRDTHLAVEGPCVAGLQLVFLEDWHYTRGQAPQGERYLPVFPEELTGEPVQILDSGPDTDFETIKIAYFAAINAAKRRVWISTAYFVPDESMLLALKSASLRGVDVRLLVSKKSDSRIVMAAARSYFDELIKAGVHVLEYQPRMLHAKTMVVDDWFSAVGTANMDNRSFRLNFEVTALVFGRRVNDSLASLFKLDSREARAVGAGERARLGVGPKLFEGVARVLSPLL